MQDALPFLIPLGFLIVFPIIWTGIVFLISRLSGWASLARRFPVAADRTPAGDAFGWSSVKLNLFGNYSNCIDVVVARQGIYMRPVWIFRAGHEPILIPWKSVTDVQSGMVGFFTITKLTVKPERQGGWPPVLRFYGKLIGESLERRNEKGDRF